MLPCARLSLHFKTLVKAPVVGRLLSQPASRHGHARSNDKLALCESLEIRNMKEILPPERRGSRGASCPHGASAFCFHAERFRLYEEFHVALEVAVVVVVVRDAEAVREDPQLHGSVGAAGEDVVGWSHLDLHHARAEVPEQRLASVFVREGVEEAVRGQAPNLGTAGRV